jgi:hypothetical protein
MPVIKMKTHGKPPHIVYWVRIPLTFTYRFLPGLHVVETHRKDLDLPILSSHRKEIERLVKRPTCLRNKRSNH